jgi:hypothetical protein
MSASEARATFSLLSDASAASAAGARRPSNRRARKLAARLAMLTYLPTRSLLTRCRKSSGLKSMSSTRALSLAAM